MMHEIAHRFPLNKLWPCISKQFFLLLCENYAVKQVNKHPEVIINKIRTRRTSIWLKLSWSSIRYLKMNRNYTSWTFQLNFVFIFDQIKQFFLVSNGTVLVYGWRHGQHYKYNTSNVDYMLKQMHIISTRKYLKRTHIVCWQSYGKLSTWMEDDEWRVTSDEEWFDVEILWKDKYGCKT